MKHNYRSGQWLAICDRCGFEFLAKDLKRDWQGLMVCSNDYELRNPQDFIRIRPEKITPPWTRPEPEDVFVQVCDMWSRQDRADYGTAGCMTVGYLSDLQLLADIFGTTSVAGYLIPGRAIASKV